MIRTATFVLAVTAVVMTPTLAGAAGISSDREIAEGSVLAIDDVPAGFEETPSSDDSPPPGGAACKDIRRGTKALDRGDSSEVDFRSPDTGNGRAIINNKVAVFEKTKAAKAAFAAYDGSDNEECFAKTYEELFLEQLDDPDATVDVTVDRYGPDLGDAAVGYEVAIAVTSQGESDTFYLDIEVIRVGRAIDAFAFGNPSNALPSDDVVQMTETGVERLEAAPL